MAKLNIFKTVASSEAPAPATTETPVVLMRRVGPERFEVVTAVLKGTLSEVKVLEKSVSLVVGRGAARKALAAQHRMNSAALGLSVDV